MNHRYHGHLQKVITVRPHLQLPGLLRSAHREIALEGKGFQLSSAVGGLWTAAGASGTCSVFENQSHQ